MELNFKSPLLYKGSNHRKKKSKSAYFEVFKLTKDSSNLRIIYYVTGWILVRTVNFEMFSLALILMFLSKAMNWLWLAVSQTTIELKTSNLAAVEKELWESTDNATISLQTMAIPLKCPIVESLSLYLT
jgi:hypothetical protein